MCRFGLFIPQKLEYQIHFLIEKFMNAAASSFF